MDMAFFLIGRGADDALQLLSANSFESRQDAMAELSRITSDSEFSHWDLEVFVVDLDAGVPVLLVRPRSEGNADAASVAEEAEVVASDDSVAAVSEEVAPPPDETEDTAPEEVCEETSTDLREALQRTAEQMSAEGIIPPPSAGLSPEPEASEGESADDAVSAAEPSDEPDAEELEAEEPEAPEAGPPSEEETAEEPADQPAEGIQSDEPLVVADQGSEEPSWPWDAAPTAPAAEPGVSPEIATVYEGLERMDEQEVVAPPGAPDADAQSVGSDFILDLEAIQPVAMQPRGTDAASPPAQPAEAPTAAQPVEAPPAEPPVEAPPAEESHEAPSGNTDFPSSMTEYTCEDCVYVETCPNRDQREPKDCGSFQWK
jgi:hypothetical protein